jgi:hypothetical protein
MEKFEVGDALDAIILVLREVRSHVHLVFNPPDELQRQTVH